MAFPKVMSSLCALLVGCSDSNVERAKIAEQKPVVPEFRRKPPGPSPCPVKLDVPKTVPITFKGFEMALNGPMLPVAGPGKFQVTGGQVISELQGAKRAAKVAGWKYVYRNAEMSTPLFWAALLSEGDLTIGDMFYASEVPQLWVDNFFEVEDGDSGCLLVRLRSDQGHRLAIYYDENYSLMITAAYPGTRILYAGHIHERKIDGWYIGDTLVHKTNTKLVELSTPPENASTFSVAKGGFADASSDVKITEKGKVVTAFERVARIVAAGENHARIAGHRKIFLNPPRKIWYFGEMSRANLGPCREQLE